MPADLHVAGAQFAWDHLGLSSAGLGIFDPQQIARQGGSQNRRWILELWQLP